MIKLILELVQIYGLGALQLAFLVWISHKFLTNHWRHFTDKINEIHKDVKANMRAVNRLSNRVSKIEGKLDK